MTEVDKNVPQGGELLSKSLLAFRPDTFDERDFPYQAGEQVAKKKVDLRTEFPDPIVQGELNSCTAIAIAAAIGFDLKKQGLVLPAPNSGQSHNAAPLFIYYNERVIEGIVDENGAVEVRDGVKSVVKTGTCSEPYWPYDVAKFKDKPPDEAYSNAKDCKAVKYYKLPINVDEMKTCLAEGYPFTLGFWVPESWISRTDPNPVGWTGNMPLPSPLEPRVFAHCVLAVGFDDEKQVLIVRNSWGTGWGDKGYFYMPYDFATGSFSQDSETKANTFSGWMIKTVT